MDGVEWTNLGFPPQCEVQEQYRWCSCTTGTSSILYITNLSQQLEFLHQFHNSWPRRCFTMSEKTFNLTNCFSEIFTIFLVQFNNFNALLKRVSFHFY